jgi:hypothetical protein
MAADPVSFHGVKCARATERAILVEIEGEDHWIPLSQVDDDSEVYKSGDQGTLVVSHWFAVKEGLTED